MESAINACRLGLHKPCSDSHWNLPNHLDRGSWDNHKNRQLIIRCLFISGRIHTSPVRFGFVRPVISRAAKVRADLVTICLSPQHLSSTVISYLPRALITCDLLSSRFNTATWSLSTMRFFRTSGQMREIVEVPPFADSVSEGDIR